jgi:hypothetical protein
MSIGTFYGRASKNSHGWNTDETRIGFRVSSVFHPWLKFLPCFSAAECAQAGLASWRNFIRWT